MNNQAGNKKRRAEAESRFRASASAAGVQVIGDYINALTSIQCVCSKGHTCYTKPNYIQQGSGWCITCAGQDPKVAEADLLQRAAKDGVVVVGTYAGSNVPVKCICPEGHECNPRPASVQQGQGWCRVCVGRDPDTAKSRFFLGAAKIGMKIVGEYVNASTNVECVCPNGHTCYPNPGHVRNGTSWCTICSGFSKKAAEYAFCESAAVAGVTIVGMYINAFTPVKCICPEGHECSPAPHAIQRGQGWCQKCVVEFNRLYLLTGEFGGELWAKVGLASTDARVSNHVNSGWQLYGQWTNLDHDNAWSVESFVKQQSRDRGWSNVDAKFMTYAGATETFPAEHLALVERWCLDRLILHDEPT